MVLTVLRLLAAAAATATVAAAAHLHASSIRCLRLDSVVADAAFAFRIDSARWLRLAAFGCIWLQGVVAEAVAVAVSVAVAVALSTGLCGRKTFSQSLLRLSSVWPPLMGCDVSTPEQLATCCRRIAASSHLRTALPTNYESNERASERTSCCINNEMFKRWVYWRHLHEIIIKCCRRSASPRNPFVAICGISRCCLPQPDTPRCSPTRSRRQSTHIRRAN